MFWFAILTGILQGIGMWLIEAAQDNAPEPIPNPPSSTPGQ